MADFTTKSVTKSAERKLSSPIDTVANFLALVQDVIENNPWGCTSYTSNNETVAGVVRGSEHYSGKIVYENAEAKTVGQISVRAPTSAAFSTNVTTIVAASAINTAMGGTPSHDSSEDSFSCALKCHNTNGETFTVTFRRDSVVVSGYEADSIVSGIETWADTVALLA
ncbi:hypothetical protein [Methanospirillum lacunae]|uniref:Uncharacterized protein n=1 Tax=Methanospirillum lacunae TaxID=668570 RepID=A0A2V2MU68_9EURY|nr:hypothetical protein [Methanospirillum lacunae]PWR69705.1 hypothetical protein DK846_16935 [Methanospirillum lacunae]